MIGTPVPGLLDDRHLSTPVPMLVDATEPQAREQH